MHKSHQRLSMYVHHPLFTQPTPCLPPPTPYCPKASSEYVPYCFRQRPWTSTNTQPSRHQPLALQEKALNLPNHFLVRFLRARAMRVSSRSCIPHFPSITSSASGSLHANSSLVPGLPTAVNLQSILFLQNPASGHRSSFCGSCGSGKQRLFLVSLLSYNQACAGSILAG
jgi:hypothetical protein